MASLSRRRLTTSAAIDESSPEKKSFNCPNCPKVLGNIDAFKLHLRIHSLTLLKCPECREEFISNQEINIHRSEVHQKELYACRYCGKGFVSTLGRKYHERMGHVLRGHTFNKKETDGKTCPVPNCMKLFLNVGAYELHYRTHAGDFRCYECKKGFQLVEDLNNHRFEVHKKILYECQFCRKGFTAEGYKNKHVRNKHAA